MKVLYMDKIMNKIHVIRGIFGSKWEKQSKKILVAARSAIYVLNIGTQAN